MEMPLETLLEILLAIVLEITTEMLLELPLLQCNSLGRAEKRSHNCH